MTKREMKDYEKYENEIKDIDEIEGTDVKINPDYYIHTAIVLAQKSLADPDINSGMLRFRMVVEHVETLSKATNSMPDDYEEKINKWKKDNNYPEKPSITDGVRLANMKLELLLQKTFSYKVNTNHLKG